MKNSITFLILIHISIYSFGQFSFGIKGGGNFSQLHGSNVPSYSSFNGHTVAGFHAGVFSKFKLTKAVSIIPEIQYSKRGNLFKASAPFNEVRHILNYIEAPVLFSFTPVKWLSLDLGPHVGYKVSAIAKTENSNVKLAMYNKNFDFGLSGGLRIHISEKLSFIGRYYYAFTPSTSLRSEMRIT